MLRFLIRAAVLACAMSCAVTGWAQAAPDATPRRAGIQAERKRLEAAFAAEEARCADRFAVTACVDDVRQRRRAALAVPRAQELALDDEERRARAAVRRQAVADKQRSAAERPVLAPVPAREARKPPPAPAPPVTHVRKVPALDEAAQRAVASQARRDKVRAGQQRIEARQAERALKGKPAAPLPVPGAASAPR